ncbi:uracil-xanthine permease family protein [Christensenellaceae bacterium OttesenSCG-928-K19]|nr:uracil-xanthine permease family protein [Christensenellaceae bacterium OttesenSCG-928-K19]
MNEKLGHKKYGIGKNIILGFQHLFAMFGATVLVPLLTGINPAVAIFCAGVGTLVFHLVTKGKVPVFLGSSFAFIGVIIITASQFSGVDPSVEGALSSQAYQDALPYVTGGIIVAGAVYLLLALIVRLVGVKRVMSIFPPIVVGPMIMVIGLTLAPTAFTNIISAPGGEIADVLWMRWVIALVVIATMVVISIFAKGFFKLVPIIMAIAVGYIVAALMGQVDFTGFQDGTNLGFQVPAFFLPKFDGRAIAIIAPVAIVTFMEHIGDITTNGAVVGKNFVEDPGLHRTLMGDGVATMLAGFLGGPANTTYGENTGVLAVTKNYNPTTLRIAAVFAVIISFFGVFSVFLGSIPGAVMGGVSILLFGMIATVGLRTLSEANLDFSHSRNLIIVSIMLVIGLGLSGGIEFSETFTLSNIFLSAIAGIVLNLVLPKEI